MCRKVAVFIALNLSIIVLSHCKKQVEEQVVPEPAVNNPPGNFAIKVDTVYWDRASVSWTKAVDPDKDSVKYKIYLNDSLLTSNYTALHYDFSKLNQLTDYTIKIVAWDAKQNETIREIKTTTPKYVLRFLKKIEYGVINEYSSQRTGQMVKTGDNGYILTGVTELRNTSGSPLQYVAIKVDTAGTEIWRKYYDFQIEGSTDVKIIQTSGGYLVAAERHLFKIDNNGELLWHSPSDEGINSLDVNSSGEIYTVGTMAGDNLNNFQIGGLSKYDKNGNKLWNKQFSPTAFDFFTNIKILADDQIIILGATDRNNTTMNEYLYGDGSPVAEFWVLKLDANGEMIWSNTYEGQIAGSAFPTEIIQTREGNLAFTGFIYSTYTGSSFFLQMIDGNGEKIWNYFDFNNPTQAESIAETNDNSLIITGAYVALGSSGSMLSFYKFDKSGNEIWNNIYQEMLYIFRGKTIIPTDDGGCIANVQRSNAYNAPGEFDQIYLFKMDENGVFAK